MADSDYKNGAVSIISAIGSSMAALGFEVTDNLEAAKTMLKMQGDVVADPTMKSHITGEYSVKTLYDGVNKVWALSGHFISWVQKWLASDKGGGYPGSKFTEYTYPNVYDFRGQKSSVPVWNSINTDDHITIETFRQHWPNDSFKLDDGMWFLATYKTSNSYQVKLALFGYNKNQKPPYSLSLNKSNVISATFERTYTITYVLSSDTYDYKKSGISNTSFSGLSMKLYKNVLPLDAEPTNGQFYQFIVSSGSYATGGGITRGGGVGRHSLPQNENFPPCGGDTTVPAITEWSGRVINWNGDCYMPITYYKVNKSNENPGTKPGEPNTPVDPDDTNFDPSDIIKYVYPNETPQSTPQLGTNPVQSTGQLVNNFTNATNGPSVIPSTNVKSGLFTLWHPSSDDLQNLGAFLYGATAQGTIASIIGNPINAIIQLTEWAVTPVDGPEKSPVICNIAATDLKMPTIPNQFMQFDCGSITIPREYSDFRDYEPYTRLSLFLPFVGEVNISTNDCILPHSIKVIYNLDFLSGAACAEVLVDGDVRYAYQAAMCAAIPVTSSDASRLLASLIGAAVGTVGGGVMGGIVGGTAGSRMMAHSLIGGVSDAAMSPINGIQIQRTGSISANTGLLGEMKPYVLVTRPISYIPDSYESLIGRPYQTTAPLGSQTGFVKVREVHLDGITATEVEKEEIESLLKKGVII